MDQIISQLDPLAEGGSSTLGAQGGGPQWAGLDLQKILQENLTKDGQRRRRGILPPVLVGPNLLPRPFGFPSGGFSPLNPIAGGYLPAYGGGLHGFPHGGPYPLGADLAYGNGGGQSYEYQEAHGLNRPPAYSLNYGSDHYYYPYSGNDF